MQNKYERRIDISKSQYYNNFIVAYINSYKELRTIIISATSYRECEEIIRARGLNSIGFIEAPDLVQYNKKRSKK